MDDVWWNQVTNANLFLNKVVDSILSEKSIVLVLPKYVPWKNRLLEKIEENISRKNFRNSFDFIESPEGNVGEFLLRRYCKEETRVLYRPNKTYACFLAEREDIVLNDRYVWVRNVPNHRMNEWITFLSEYHKSVKKDNSPGVFILETSDSDAVHTSKKGILKIVYNKEMNFFDTYTFCTLAVSSEKQTECLKNYLAELAANICGNDIELCAECITNGRKFLENPIDTLKSIMESSVRSDGMPFVVQLNEAAIKNSIWKTQLKMIFPIIEDYRGIFVKQYHSKIAQQLPINSSNGEHFTEPEDVEIGTLNYMAASGLITVSTSDHNKLHQLKEARNTLAHLKTLVLTEVTAILQYQ